MRDYGITCNVEVHKRRALSTEYWPWRPQKVICLDLKEFRVRKESGFRSEGIGSYHRLLTGHLSKVKCLIYLPKILTYLCQFTVPTVYSLFSITWHLGPGIQGPLQCDLNPALNVVSMFPHTGSARLVCLHKEKPKTLCFTRYCAFVSFF